VSAGKPAEGPVILSANALLDGDVVYWAGPGWSVHLGNALVAYGESAVERLAAVKARVDASGEVVAAELVPVALDRSGRIVPGHYREKIRALGPTVRRDLGPQARGENDHVSL